MPLLKGFGFVAALAILGGVYGPAAAQQAQPVRQAFVIGNSDYSSGRLDRPAKDATSVSRALLGLGFDVIRRENVSADTMEMNPAMGGTVLLYFSGRTDVVEGETMLLPTSDAQSGWPVVKTAQALRDAGAARVIVLIETCHADDKLSVPEIVSEADSSDAAADPSSVAAPEPAIFIAYSTDPATGCQADADDTLRFSDRVLAALATPATDFAAAFDAAEGQGWALDRLGALVVFGPATDGSPKQKLTDEDMALLERLPEKERARMRALWAQAGLMGGGDGVQPVPGPKKDTIIITAPLKPANRDTITLTPQRTAGMARPSAATSGLVPVSARANASSAVQIFNATPRPRVAAQPTAAGLPSPSIIVGEIKPTNASFSPTETGALSGSGVDGGGYDEREALRNSDPDLFKQLVESGAFDPPAGSEARALQVVLQRMSCYTAGIDGDWGRGSRAAVDRYFAQAGGQPATRDAVPELFRQIIMKEDVTCPAQRTAAAPARSNNNSTARNTSRNTGTSSRSTARKPAAQPAKKPAASSGQPNFNRLGSGIIR